MPLKFQARSKDQEILEEGGGAGPSNLPRRDDEYGDGAGLSKLDLFCFESSKLFINSSAADIVFVTVQAQAVATASIAAVHKSLGNGEGTPPLHFHCSGGGPRSLRSFSGGFRGRAFTLSSRPSHSVPARP